MHECHDTSILLGDDQAGRFEVNRTEGMSVQFMHAQRAYGAAGGNCLVPELDQGGGIGVTERAESCHRSGSPWSIQGRLETISESRNERSAGMSRGERAPGSRNTDQDVFAFELDLVNGLLDLRPEGSLP